MSDGLARETAPVAPAPDRMSAVEWFALAAVMALGLALRVREALRTPPWFDELFTLWMARHPFGGMMRLLRDDIHPPLPTLMVALWRGMGGDGILWLRTLPLVIGIATLAVTYGFVRELIDRRTALIATTLLVLQPMHVYFSQELRSYGQLALALVLTAWGAWGWTRTGGLRHAVLWTIGMVLTLHTHYLGAIVLLFVDLWVLQAVRREPSRLRGWAAIHLVVLIAMLPIAGMLAAQIPLSRHHWIPVPTVAAFADYLRMVTYGAWYLMPPLLVLALAPLRVPRLRDAASFLLWISLPSVLLAFVLTRLGAHLFSGRYWFVLLPFWCALFAAGLVALPGRMLRALATLVLILFAWRACILWAPHREAVGLKWAARILKPRVHPGDALYCIDTHSLMTLDYHLGAPRGVLLGGEINLPPYLGSALVPPERRMPIDSVVAGAGAGRRWWAVRTESGRSTAGTAARLDSLARGGSLHQGPVTVWAGEMGMFADR